MSHLPASRGSNDQAFGYLGYDNGSLLAPMALVIKQESRCIIGDEWYFHVQGISPVQGMEKGWELVS